MRLFTDVSLRGSCQTAISFPHLEGMTVHELEAAADVFTLLRRYAGTLRIHALSLEAGDGKAAQYAAETADDLYDALVRSGVYSQRRIANEDL